MHTVEHPNRTAPLNREVDALMDRERISLTPRKAAPLLPSTLDEINVARIPTYGHTDCPQICAATYGGKTRHAIVIVADPVRRIVCVVPQERLVQNGRTVKEWFGTPITLDHLRVTPLPMDELHPELRSQAMTWLAERREAVADELRNFFDELDRDNVLGPLGSSRSPHCPGCDELADHSPLSFPSGQHAA